MAVSHIFKGCFTNQGKVYEIYARKVSHGSLFGFVEWKNWCLGNDPRGGRSGRRESEA